MIGIPPAINVTAKDWHTILPELMVLGFVIVMLLVDAVMRDSRKVVPWIALAGVVAGMASTAAVWRIGAGKSRLGFYAMVVRDNFGLLMCGIILFGAFIAILLSVNYIRREEIEHGDYYALMLLAAAGMMLMAASADLIMVFLSLEVLSIALYILSAYASRRPKSEEAGMKYLLLGAFASAFLLYGIALVYGSTGTTNLVGIAAALASATIRNNTMLLTGTGLVLVGLAFKVSAVPFQVWTPDVYEGAPASITAFMSVGTKVAAFAALVRVLVDSMSAIWPAWMPAVWVIAAVTMIGGNLVAIAQTNIKRMLAYSSIAHAGYVLVGITAANRSSVAAVPFYLLAYAFVNLGAWAVVIAVSRKGEVGMDLQDHSGLFWRNPGVAIAMGLFMFGLAGIPPTAGFVAKFYIFYAALQRNMVGLVVIGVITTVISVYFYLRITVLMFMNPPKGEPRQLVVPVALTVALIIAAVGTLVMGVYPSPFFTMAEKVLPLGF